MPEYLSPGVYIEEFEIGAKPIEGVATSTAAFLGPTERGASYAQLVTSWLEYERIYGGYFVQPDDRMPLAVKAFFDNGGLRAFILRIVELDDSASAVFEDSGMTFTAVGEGTWGNRVFLRFSRASSAPVEPPAGGDTSFRLRVYYWSTFGDAPDDFEPFDAAGPMSDEERQRTRGLPRPTLVEDFDDLDLRPDSPNFVQRRVDRVSALVGLRVGATPKIPDLDTPQEPEFQALGNGADGDGEFTLADYQGRAAVNDDTFSTGLVALDEPPQESVAIVYAPIAYEVAGLEQALITHCELNRFRFLILDSKRGEHETGKLDPRSKNDTKYAAFYYPWYEEIHPYYGRPVMVPPGGAVAGIYARSDNERGVWKAPANEVVRGAIELEFDISKGQQDVLNPRGVNVIRLFPGRGIRVWGARTLSSDPLWKYVNVRRLFIFLEASIYRGAQWVVFEPNNEQLWARVRQTITQFLRTQWRAGALMGLKEEEAFFVKVDRSTMTQDDIDNGRLIVLIGVAPVKPAEFVIFRFAQFTATANANG